MKAVRRRAVAFSSCLFLLVSLGLGSSGGAAARQASAGASAPQQLQDRVADPKPIQRAVPAGYSQKRLHLKFREGTGVHLQGQDFVSDDGADLLGLEKALTSFPPAWIERLFSAPRPLLDDEVSEIETDSGRELADLRLYFRVAIQATSDMESLLAALNALSIVEVAYPEPLPASVTVTPDFVGLQGYRAPAPDGIDAESAAGVPGGLGDNVRVIDIEYSWNLTHEDLSKAQLPGALSPNKTPLDPFSNNDHGTAVLGELVADDNGFGVTGLVPNASLGMVNAANVEDGYDLQDSIFMAHQNLSPGDVMLIEQQVAGAFGGCGLSQVGCVAVEWIPAFYDAIVAATADGIIVVEAAGNGSQDLDDPAYGSPFPGGRPDSGAIIVGAGASPSCGPLARSRLSFSTFGSRVDLQGWGECVATTGYGDLQGVSQANDAYTGFFGGTSSASPIVAAAAASLSSALEQANGVPSIPRDVRAQLIATGTPQDIASVGSLPGEIGPLPDLRAALVTSPVAADLSITKSDSPEPVTIGGALNYTLEVSNDGPDEASNVTVVDELPVSATFVSASSSQGTCSPSEGIITCLIGTMGPGEVATIEIQVTPTAEGLITNSVSVTSDVLDPDPGDNTASEETTVQTAPTGLTDVKVRKDDGRDPGKVGRPLPYQVVIRNRGKAPATGVTLIDQLPAGVIFVSASPRQGICGEAGGIVTCDLGSLAKGRRTRVKIVVTPTASGILTNTVEVSSFELDPDTTNNQDIETTTVTET